MASEIEGRPRCVVVASGNAHKIAEIEQMLSVVPGLTVRGQRDFGEPPEIEETEPDFAGNARLKAEGIAAWLREAGEAGDMAVLADDSGVCVDAFDGRPGVRSARFAGEPCDDAANNDKLVAELRARGLSASAGHYRCVLALVRVDGAPWADGGPCHTFDGRWDVELRVARQGTGGFGYDPHAWLPQGCTVAELSREDKAAVSHRGHAMRALLGWLQGD